MREWAQENMHIMVPATLEAQSGYTVEPVLIDHPFGHKNMVSQDRWSLVTGSFTLT